MPVDGVTVAVNVMGVFLATGSVLSLAIVTFTTPRGVTVMIVEFDFVSPPAPVPVAVTVNVPAELYVWDTLVDPPPKGGLVVPSPKFTTIDWNVSVEVPDTVTEKITGDP